jgi:hypothetical protein
MDPGLERFRERLSQLAAIEGALAPHILRGASGWDGGRACAQCKAGRGDTSRSYWGAPDAAASDQRGIAGGLAIPQSGYGAFGLRRSAWKID